jgi:hypothetical protein
MAVKTFTSEILTSADTNTYLANSGLVYVTSATVGTGVASVTVTGAFNSTFDNYRIVYTGGTGSGSVSMTIGGTATAYSNTMIYGSTYGTPTALGIGSNNGANWQFVGWCDANICHVGLDLFSPNLAKYTSFGNCSYASATNAGSNQGIHATATAYTSFTLIPAGTLTGGTITVYGYRKA